MTELPLYHPAWQVPFQLDLAARSYLLRQSVLVADMGTGKTHVGMALSAAALMYGDADLVVIFCEKNKLYDWRDELAAHSEMKPAVIYHGPRRGKILQDPDFRVLITTYETGRQDLARFQSRTSRKGADGPLLEMLLERRPVIIYDEASAKLGNRSSALYKAHAHMLRRLRSQDPRMIISAMTGTPIERDYENAFNLFRLVAPQIMPMVKDFEGYYTYGRDEYQRLRFRRDRMPEFATVCQDRMLRKRKTDPDVAAQFPEKTEEFIRAEMHSDQERLYRFLEDLAWDENGEHSEPPGLGTLLRQLAGHPAAVLRSEGKLAALVRDHLGRQLTACSSAKTVLLLEHARRILDEDAKLLVFTFFGQSVLPVLADQLALESIPVYVTHGGMSAREQHEERQRFRVHPGGAVLLSSDAGARGVNLPEASCVIEYETGLTHALRTQRFARAHRLGQGGGPLTCLTFVLEKTIEVALTRQALSRNEQQDTLLGDNEFEAMKDGYLTADQRRLLFAQARRRK